jgi:hypothetical protein
MVPPPQPAQSPAPQKNKKWLIIAGAVVLLAIAGGVAWWLMSSGKTPTDTVEQKADTASVRSVSWIEPLDIPASYKKYDDSSDSTKTFTYADSNYKCDIITDIAPFGMYSRYGKTPLDVVREYEKDEGVTIVKEEAGPSLEFKDVNGSQTYKFDTVLFEKDLDLKDVDFKKEFTLAAYKPFGVYAVTISYTCREANWNKQKGELEKIVKQFTLRTER